MSPQQLPRVATPAITAAKTAGIWHRIHSYDHDPAARSFGDEAVQQLGITPRQIYKTLIVSTPTGHLINAVLAVADMLHPKRMAAALQVKTVQLADATLAQRKTGYVLGGISPLGQKTILPTVIDTAIVELDTVLVSAGQRGLSLELRPADLIAVTHAVTATIRR